MTRAVFRFVPFTVAQDPNTVPTYQACCVSGDETACGQDSDEWITPHPIELWMDAHTKQTGHRHYRRAFYDNALYQAPDTPSPGEATERP